MKKLLSLSLVAITVFSLLAGCGKAGGASSSSNAVSEKSSTSDVASGGGSTSPFKNKDLEIAVFEGGYGADYWNAIVDKFEKAYPGVKVNMQISPTIADTIRPQIASGKIPDFLVLNGQSYSVITTLITEKGLLDITDVFKGKALNSDKVLGDTIRDGLLNSSVCAPYGNGKIYQAPLTAAPTGLIYNKALFEKNGWEVPVTWDEFFALGEKEQGMALFTYQGIYPTYLENMLLPAMESALGPDDFSKIMSYQEGSVLNTAALDVLKNFERISREGYMLPGTVALNHTQSQQEQMMNKALFIPCGTWMESEMAKSPRADGYEFAMAPAPVMKAGDTRYVFTAMETMSIPAAAKNPELAKEFLRFLYTDDAICLFAQKANGVGPTKNATEMSKDYISKSIYQMYSIYNEKGVVPTVPAFGVQAKGSKINVTDEFWNPAADVVNGTKSAKDWAQSIENSFAQVRSELKAAH